ncbi:unnamed protein product [Lymnaea stagnalis]|uniref:Uncharacterized protein n=1 Tax=Lymnaea stagnalis TaxID=6523 RepID=A0AAV2I596_LYMST
MELKNWNLAEKYARIATSMYSTNSFLWDTYSQVFKNQLQDKIVTENSLDKGGFDESDIHEVISLSKKCIQRFRKEQKASENESSTDGENNFAGYFGELRAIVLLLSGLKQFQASRKVDILHKYLIEENFKHPAFDFLTDEESDFIRSLGKFSQEAMRRLDEEYLQMKETASSESSTQSFENGNRSLLILKVNIDSYFGEANKNPSRSLSEKDKSIYRYHTARYLGATSLNNLLQMKQNGEHKKLKQIYRLLHENVSMDNSSFDNLLALMDTVTVMLLDQVIQVDLKYEQILEWCKQLRSLVKTKSVDRIYLEPYLYYVLFNFPTEERSSHKLCLPLDLSSTLDLWHDAFQKSIPSMGRSKQLQEK